MLLNRLKKFIFNPLPIKGVWTLDDIRLNALYAVISEPIQDIAILHTSYARGIALHRDWANKERFQQFGDKEKVPHEFMPLCLPNGRYLFVRKSTINKLVKVKQCFTFKKLCTQ